MRPRHLVFQPRTRRKERRDLPDAEDLVVVLDVRVYSCVGCETLCLFFRGQLAVRNDAQAGRDDAGTDARSLQTRRPRQSASGYGREWVLGYGLTLAWAMEDKGSGRPLDE